MANEQLAPDEPITDSRRRPDGPDERERRQRDHISPAPPRRWPWLLAVLVVVVVIGYLLIPRLMRGFQPAPGQQSRTNGREAGATAGQGAVGTSGQANAPGGRGGRGGALGVVQVTAARAHLGELPVYLTGLGSVTAYDTVTVRTRVDGQLIKVAFREGQNVKAGDLLAEIDPRPYLVQLTQAQGQLAKDEATLKNAQLDLARYQALLAKDAVSKQQVDTQQATVNQSEGAIESDRGAVDAAKLNLVYTRITAPVDGRVGLRQVDPGNMVHAADQNGIVVLTRIHPITLIFTLTADTLPQVVPHLGTRQRLQVEAWNRDLTTRLAIGSLLSIDNEIDPATSTFRLKAVFPNDHDELFPNQFVNARLRVDTLANTVLVPTAAVQQGPDGSYVWVVGPDGRVQMRPCSVRLTEGDQTAIASGVTDGQTVVTDGVDRLRDGTRVQAHMMETERPAGGPGGRGGRAGAPANNGAAAGQAPPPGAAPGNASPARGQRPR